MFVFFHLYLFFASKYVIVLTFVGTSYVYFDDLLF